MSPRRRRLAQRHRRVTEIAMRSPCPVEDCQAPPGSWCWQNPGVSVGMHVARRLAASQIERSAR